MRVSTREQAEKGEGEEGFSIPAQREARRPPQPRRRLGTHRRVRRPRRVRQRRGPGRRSKRCSARIAEHRHVDVVVVHKIDRLTRNMEDQVAIRALLRKRSVALISVTENVEETASGRFVEGIHALLAEFYSANLASEIRKGITEKAKQGGFPHAAPSAISTFERPSPTGRSPGSSPTRSVHPSSPWRSTCTLPGELFEYETLVEVAGIERAASEPVRRRTAAFSTSCEGFAGVFNRLGGVRRRQSLSRLSLWDN
ncbi:MAG: recombinase family protein [Mycobacteriales bacterium]